MATGEGGESMGFMGGLLLTVLLLAVGFCVGFLAGMVYEIVSVGEAVEQSIPIALPQRARGSRWILRAQRYRAPASREPECGRRFRHDSGDG